MNKKQVEKEHYFKKYDSRERFLSYHEQIIIITSLKPKSVLEIGVGNNFLNRYLKNLNYNIETVDFDKELKPDYVDDIRELKNIKKMYDVVCAFEVLEHLPFKDFETTLKKIKDISKKYVVISIPYSASLISLAIRFNIPFTNFTKYFNFMIPYFFYKIDFKKNKQHYWELGSKGYSKNKIKNIIKKHYKIVKKYHLNSNPKHYFYILEKK